MCGSRGGFGKTEHGRGWHRTVRRSELRCPDLASFIPLPTRLAPQPVSPPCRQWRLTIQQSGSVRFLRAGFDRGAFAPNGARSRSEEHTSELQSLMRISYAVFCLKKKNNINYNITHGIT